MSYTVTENWRSSTRQPRSHRWHHELSQWLPRVPPTATKPPNQRSTIINGYGRIGSYGSHKLCDILSYILWKKHVMYSHESIWALEDKESPWCHPSATHGIGGCHFDNLRCHQRRQSRHHDNSRPSADVLRVEIFAKANLQLAQIPPHPIHHPYCKLWKVYY